MSDSKQPRNYTPYQQKIIKRYYDNTDTIQGSRLSELVGELYLAEGKKKEKVWKDIGQAMIRLNIPQSRIDHLLKQRKPELIADLIKELQK